MLAGEQNPDQLFGFTGNDTLFGGEGDDRLLGEDGNDQITSGRGFDIIDGGAGADRFLFEASDIAPGESDQVSFFDPADRYVFQAGLSLSYEQFSGSATIAVNFAGGQFRLDVFGATAAQLQAQTDFLVS